MRKMRMVLKHPPPIFFAPIGHWDWGWLWVYLLAYLPAMYAFRFLLKIA